MERTTLGIVVGAVLGAVATYFVVKNKDVILGKLEELEDKIEDTLRQKGITPERAKEIYEKISQGVQISIGKIKDVVSSKENLSDLDKDTILKEIEDLKSKLARL